MSLPWVKFHVSALDSIRCQRAGERGWYVWSKCVLLAQRCGRNGALDSSLGPMTLEEIDRAIIGRGKAALKATLDHLVSLGLMTTTDGGGYAVTGFEEKQGESPSTQRVRAHRKRVAARKSDADGTPLGIPETPDETPDETFHETPKARFETQGETLGNASGNADGTALDRERDEDGERAKTSVLATVATPPAREPRQGKLPDPEIIRAREILGLVWSVVQPVLGTATNKTSFSKRNSAAARSLANSGKTDEAILGALERASKRLGSQVYSVRIIEDQFIREAAGVIPLRPGERREPAPRKIDMSRDADSLENDPLIRRAAAGGAR